MNAPIALFIFNRPIHLRRTLTALARCDGFATSPIFIFGDGPRDGEDRRNIDAARAVAKEFLAERATYQFQKKNLGLARSIIDGVRLVLAEYGRVIVLEDDLDLAPGFLGFMNAALERYDNEPQVFQISGYAFDAPELMSRSEAAFLPFTGTWGWGTWRRAWSQFDESANGWEMLDMDEDLRRRFNLGGIYDYSAMLERQMAGWRDSWGIRWYWSVFVRDGLVLYPPRTLVNNKGFDGSGSHGRGIFRRFGKVQRPFDDRPISLPAPHLDAAAFAAVQRALLRQNGGPLGRVVDLLKRSGARFWP